MLDHDPYRNLLKPPQLIDADQLLAGTALDERVCDCPECHQRVSFHAQWYRAFCRNCGQELHRLGLVPGSEIVPVADPLTWHHL